MMEGAARVGFRSEVSAILSVSPVPKDHCVLDRMLQDWVLGSGTNSRWQLSTAGTVASALETLRRVPCPVLICERDLAPDSWRDLLEHTQVLATPPLVIVTSIHADEYLWVEALSLGAYDVLAKPFDRTELMRVLQMACDRWLLDRSHAAGKSRRRQTAKAT